MQYWCPAVSIPVFQTGGVGSNPIYCSIKIMFGNSVLEVRRPPAEKVSEVVSDSPRKGLFCESNVGQLKKVVAD